MDDLIEAVEAIRRNPDDCKDYENNYRTGWWDACNTVLELLHARLTHDRPPEPESLLAPGEIDLAQRARAARRPKPSLAKRAIHILGTHGDLSPEEHSKLSRFLEEFPE
jgi:hypothetical protein